MDQLGRWIGQQEASLLCAQVRRAWEQACLFSADARARACVVRRRRGGRLCNLNGALVVLRGHTCLLCRRTGAVTFDSLTLSLRVPEPNPNPQGDDALLEAAARAEARKKREAAEQAAEEEEEEDW